MVMNKINTLGCTKSMKDLPSHMSFGYPRQVVKEVFVYRTTPSFIDTTQENPLCRNEYRNMIKMCNCFYICVLDLLSIWDLIYFWYYKLIIGLVLDTRWSVLDDEMSFSEFWWTIVVGNFIIGDFSTEWTWRAQNITWWTSKYYKNWSVSVLGVFF